MPPSIILTNTKLLSNINNNSNNIITVRCSAYGIPPPNITFVSARNEAMLEQPSHTVAHGNVTAELQFQSNFTFVNCHATNKHGREVVQIGIQGKYTSFY